MTKFLSLEPFVPSGPDFTQAKAFFQELGFLLTWNAGGYAGFAQDSCRFILQDYNEPTFAQNLMLSVRVSDIQAFRQLVLDKELPEKYGIKLGAITSQPYGQEVNIIDAAGVCWHFIE